jgi:hypothetical protein
VIFQCPSLKSIGLDCAPMDLTSDPHAWLRPYYVALKNDRAFWMLAAPQRFEALCCAVEPEQPSRAATMREWSPAAKDGIRLARIRHFAWIYG